MAVVEQRPSSVLDDEDVTIIFCFLSGFKINSVFSILSISLCKEEPVTMKSVVCARLISSSVLLDIIVVSAGSTDTS